MDKLTIFLSHSHKDIEKVRKIRDLFELLGCEPLIFYLKCLDNDDGNLQDFIKKEIEARNIFLYCKSKNAEKSKWVQEELKYIKSVDKKRLYQIDIDKAFEIGVFDLLSQIGKIIKSNKIFLDYAYENSAIAISLQQQLKQAGVNTYSFDTIESESIDIEHFLDECLYVPLITNEFCKSSLCMSNFIEVVESWGNKKTIAILDSNIDKHFIDEHSRIGYCIKNYKPILETVELDLNKDLSKEFIKFLSLLENIDCVNFPIIRDYNSSIRKL